MAAGQHLLTNKGKLRLMQGKWDDTGGTAIGVGCLVGASLDTDIDTAAEIADLNTVADLLAVATECTAAGYSRQTLTRSAATEDDTNDRVNLDASDVSFGAAVAVGQTVNAVFYFGPGANDAARELYSIDALATPIPTNGSGLSYPIADAYRAS